MADRNQIRADHPDSWIAVEAGDTIVGTVTDVTESWSAQRNQGSYYPLLTLGKIQEATGYDVSKLTELKVHCFGTILFNEVMRHQPEVGEKVKVLYKGTGQAKKAGQNPPELYSLQVAGRADAGARAYGRVSELNVPVERPVRAGFRSGAPVQAAEAPPAPAEDVPDSWT